MRKLLIKSVLLFDDGAKFPFGIVYVEIHHIDAETSTKITWGERRRSNQQITPKISFWEAPTAAVAVDCERKLTWLQKAIIALLNGNVNSNANNFNFYPQKSLFRPLPSLWGFAKRQHRNMDAHSANWKRRASSYSQYTCVNSSELLAANV
jgi:hypothetical protein